MEPKIGSLMSGNMITEKEGREVTQNGRTTNMTEGEGIIKGGKNRKIRLRTVMMKTGLWI